MQTPHSASSGESSGAGSSGSSSSGRSSISHWPFVFVVIVLGLVAVALYWPTLQMPLIYDDLLHIRITKSLDWLSVWLPAQAFGFYRPLTFFPLLIIKQLFGHYPAELLHGLNTLQHAANVVLLATLSWRLWHKLRWAAASGLLLALFPFSYQAVAVYGHNVHPTTSGLLLLALHTYLYAIRSKNRSAIWWIFTGILFLFSLLSHETAVLFGAFAALVQWNDEGHLPNLDLKMPGRTVGSLFKQPWFIFLLLGALYAVFYQFLPLSRAPQASFAGGALWFKFLYVLQAAAYPLAWFGKLLPANPGLTNGLVFLGLAAMLGLTAWSARQVFNRLPLLLGWGWWGLASLIIVLTLPAGYLLHGPRLLYLSSVGLALLWPVLLEPIYRLSKIGRLLWVVALGFVLVTSWLFVRDRLEEYAMLTSPVDVVATVMEERPAGEGVLLVNLPDWLAPATNTYPIGVELVAMLGDYLFVEELIEENLQLERPVMNVTVPDLLAGQDYTYGIHDRNQDPMIEASWAQEGSHVFIVDYAERGPETRYVGGFNRQAGGGTLATFGPYELLAAAAGDCNGTITLETSWRLASDGDSKVMISPTTSLFVQLLSDDGLLVSQADGPPLGLRPDLIHIRPAWQIFDRREFLPGNDQASTILLGAYDYVSGQRYPATDAEKSPLPNDALSLTVTECFQ